MQNRGVQSQALNTQSSETEEQAHKALLVILLEQLKFQIEYYYADKNRRRYFWQQEIKAPELQEYSLKDINTLIGKVSHYAILYNATSKKTLEETSDHIAKKEPAALKDMIKIVNPEEKTTETLSERKKEIKCVSENIKNNAIVLTLNEIRTCHHDQERFVIYSKFENFPLEAPTINPVENKSINELSEKITNSMAQLYAKKTNSFLGVWDYFTGESTSKNYLFNIPSSPKQQNLIDILYHINRLSEFGKFKTNQTLFENMRTVVHQALDKHIEAKIERIWTGQTLSQLTHRQAELNQYKTELANAYNIDNTLSLEQVIAKASQPKPAEVNQNNRAQTSTPESSETNTDTESRSNTSSPSHSKEDHFISSPATHFRTPKNNGQSNIEVPTSFVDQVLERVGLSLNGTIPQEMLGKCKRTAQSTYKNYSNNTDTNIMLLYCVFSILSANVTQTLAQTETVTVHYLDKTAALLENYLHPKVDEKHLRETIKLPKEIEDNPKYMGLKIVIEELLPKTIPPLHP